MSSVTSFIRQIPVSAQYYNAAVVVAGAATLAFEFVPTSGNYVGNYPPGYVQNSAALAVAIAAASAASSGAVVLRDMGKTIYAGIGATPVAYGRFRQVQVLVPSVGTNNFIGGTTGSTSGVIGGPAIGDAYTNYMTIYLPVVHNGIVPSVAANAISTSSALGGAYQM